MNSDTAPKIGTLVIVGRFEEAILESYSDDGRRYEVRRFRGGKPAKSTAWYEGIPRAARSAR